MESSNYSFFGQMNIYMTICLSWICEGSSFIEEKVTPWLQQAEKWVCDHCSISCDYVEDHRLIIFGGVICGFVLLLLLLKQKCYVEENSALLNLFDLAKTAYESGNAEILIHLVDTNRLDVNYKHHVDGLTLFLCACLSGDREIVSYLLKKGANVNIRTKDGDSALYLATFGVLNSSNPDVTLLQELIDAGCKVNVQNKKGYTPLHRAACKGNLDVIKCLRKNGADPYITNKAGVYPIDSATNAGHIEAAEMLKIKLENPYLWDIIEPHTPPRVRLGLQSPLKKHLLESSLPTLQRVKTEIFI